MLRIRSPLSSPVRRFTCLSSSFLFKKGQKRDCFLFFYSRSADKVPPFSVFLFPEKGSALFPSSLPKKGTEAFTLDPQLPLLRTGRTSFPFLFSGFLDSRLCPPPGSRDLRFFPTVQPFSCLGKLETEAKFFPLSPYWDEPAKLQTLTPPPPR